MRHVAEPILLIAHESRDRLIEAEADVDFEPSEPLFDAERSPKIFKKIAINKGSLEAGFAVADEIVEGEYRVGHQEHVYIETNGVIAVPGNGGITLHGSLQCPYYVQKALCVVLGLPPEKVRVVQAETGGGFGGKEEYPSIIAAHACLLALKSGRPVKMIYDRAEDMEATTKRHPAIVRTRAGVTRRGRLTALDVDVVLDGGAYMTLSPVVLSRGVIHATGPYRCDNVRVTGRVVMTNTPPNGAFRGFGAPQTQFAAEVHMERDRRAPRHGRGAVARNQRAAGRRHDGHGPGARTRHERPEGAPGRGRAHRLQAPPPRAARHEPRPRPRPLLPRRRLHRRRRGEAGVEGLGRADRARRARAGGQRRDRPGRQDGPRADRGRHARPPLRGGRGGPRRHGNRARQRPHRRLAHLDGGRRPPAEVRGRDEAEARRTRAARVPASATARSSSRSSTRRRQPPRSTR